MKKPFAVEYTVSGKRRYFETQAEAFAFKDASKSECWIMKFCEASGEYITLLVIPGNEGRVTEGKKLVTVINHEGNVDRDFENFKLSDGVNQVEEVMYLPLDSTPKGMRIQLLGRSTRRPGLTEEQIKDIVIYGAAYTQDGKRVPPQSVTMDFGPAPDASVVVTGMRLDGEPSPTLQGLIGRTVIVDLKTVKPTALNSQQQRIYESLLRNSAYGKHADINALYGKFGTKTEIDGMWSDSDPAVFMAFYRAMRHARHARKAQAEYRKKLFRECESMIGKRKTATKIRKFKANIRKIRFLNGYK